MERWPERLSGKERAEYYRGLAVEALVLQQTAYSDRAQLDPESANESDGTPPEPRLDLKTQAVGGCATTSDTAGARGENPKNNARTG